MNIAFFDFDGTISRGDSFALFLRFILGRKFYVKLAQNLPILCAYKMGLIGNGVAKERILKSCLGGMKVSDLHKKCADFLPILEGICKDSAIAKVKWHKANGDKVVLVSASFEEYLAHLAQNLGIEVIATKMQVVGDKITGAFATPNCYGAQKVARIKERFDLGEFEKIYAYGDTRGDNEMLDLAHHAFYRVFK
ncbi:HAD family hydrolase [Helicobacter sp. 23-1044]